MWFDIGIHMLLEAIGGLVLLYAYKFCEHRLHQILVWFVLAFGFSYITVQIVG